MTTFRWQTRTTKDCENRETGSKLEMLEDKKCTPNYFRDDAVPYQAVLLYCSTGITAQTFF